MREYKERIYWNAISIYQNLSEKFIREFQARVDWNDIISCQSYSTDFIMEFKDYIDKEYFEELCKEY